MRPTGLEPATLQTRAASATRFSAGKPDKTIKSRLLCH